MVGCLWNGEDAPPETMDGAGRNYLKVIRSRNGVTVTLDDHEILNDVIGSGEGGFRADARGKPFHKDLSTRTDTESDVERAVYRDPAEAAWDDYVGWSNPHPGGARSCSSRTGRTTTPTTPSESCATSSSSRT